MVLWYIRYGIAAYGALALARGSRVILVTLREKFILRFLSMKDPQHMPCDELRHHFIFDSLAMRRCSERIIEFHLFLRSPSVRPLMTLDMMDHLFAKRWQYFCCEKKFQWSRYTCFRDHVWFESYLNLPFSKVCVQSMDSLFLLSGPVTFLDSRTKLVHPSFSTLFASVLKMFAEHFAHIRNFWPLHLAFLCLHTNCPN